MKTKEVLLWLEAEDRETLLLIRKKASEIIETFRPMRLSSVWKRCGRQECTCNDSLDDRHGPYLNLSYNNDKGERVQRSLGPKWQMEDLWDMSEEGRPVWYEPVFVVPDGALRKVRSQEQRREKGWERRDLSDKEFARYYGLALSEDQMTRTRSLWILQDAYQSAVQSWEDMQEIAISNWATHGVGNLKAIRLLDSLLKSGYFLAS